MKIQGSFSADVTKYVVKSNLANDGQTAALDVAVGITKAEAAEKFGADFEKLAFGTMHVKQADPGNPESVDKVAFLVDSIKPGANVVMERHVIELDGEPLQEQPKLLSVETQDGVERVLVHLRIPIDVDRAERMKLGGKVGKTITVKFNPQQGNFDFKTHRGGTRNGHNLGKSNGAGEENDAPVAQA